MVFFLFPGLFFASYFGILSYILICIIFGAWIFHKFHNRTSSAASIVNSILTNKEIQNPELVRLCETFTPFIHSEPPISIISIIKRGLSFGFLFPFRFSLFFSSLVLFSLFAATFGRIIPPNPSKGGIYALSFRLCSFVLSFLSSLCLFACGMFKITHINPENKYKGDVPTIITNHTSFLDPFLLSVYLPLPSFIAKADVANYPIIGGMAKFFNSLFAKREEKGGKGISELISERQKSFKKGYQPLVIFPEGTTTNGNYLLKFKTGAFRSGLAVQPILIRYINNKSSPFFDTIPLHLHVIKLMLSWKTDVEIIYLPPYYPSKQEKENSEVYAENVYKLMLEKGKSFLSFSDADLTSKRQYQNLLSGKETLKDFINKSKKNE